MNFKKQNLIFNIIFILIGASFSNSEDLPYPPHSNISDLPKSALIETTKGLFEIEFEVNAAPNHVRNFEYLALIGFYNNIRIHRKEPGFLVQMGDPRGDGKGGPGYSLLPEFSDLKHGYGSVGMARFPDQMNPQRLSSGSQFYVTYGNARHLDGLYTLFAKVSKGMENVEKLEVGDRILSVKLNSDHKTNLKLSPDN